MKEAISKKINFLNQIALHLRMEEDNLSVIKNFTEGSIKIFEADFGFVWGKFDHDSAYRLTYKSSHTPYNPSIPQKKEKKFIEGGKRKNSLFDSNVKKGDYKPDISRYFKSFLIIPVRYGDHVYGSMVLGYKKKHNFTEEELALSDNIGNMIAQLVTINWLLKKEEKSLALAEKQKEIEILLEEDKLKTEFIANAAHELRTPLAIIKGNIDLAMLKGKVNSATSQSAFKAIDEEINHLSGILSDLTVITSKRDYIKKRMVHDKVNIKSLVREVIDRCRVLAKKKNISITSNGIPNLTILGHEAYLQKMLINLVKNSITYGNKNGHTRISATKSKGFITLNVVDDGIGISEEDLPHVFERFYRADKSHNSSGNNTGLGLSIVEWVVETHGGRVSVKSLKNKGTTFSVSLPIRDIKDK